MKRHVTDTGTAFVRTDVSVWVTAKARAYGGSRESEIRVLEVAGGVPSAAAGVAGGGRVMQVMGDNILAEFVDPGEGAAQCLRVRKQDFHTCG